MHRRGFASGWVLFAASAGVFFACFHWNVFGVVNTDRFHCFDKASESLVVGRLVQSRQAGLLSCGGLTGFGRRPLGRGESPFLFSYGGPLFDFQYDAYLDGRKFQWYSPYRSQIGGQAIALSLLDAVIPVSARARLALYHAVAAALSSIALALIARWFLLEIGLAPALAVILSVVMSQWLTFFGRNLWWSLWAFYLPMLCVMHFFHSRSTSDRRRPGLLGVIIAASVFVKCLFNGYEYMTTTLIMMVTPLVYYHLRNGLRARPLLIDGAVVLAASALAIMLSFAVLFVQIVAVDGRFHDGLDHVEAALERRTLGLEKGMGVDDSAFRAGVPHVIGLYGHSTFFELQERVPFSCGGFVDGAVLDLRYWLLAIVFVLGSVGVWLCSRSSASQKLRRPCLALIGAMWFSLLAPLSWLVIFKAHSYAHTHLNPVVWQMPSTLFGFALVGVATAHVAARCLGKRGCRIAGFIILLAWAVLLLAMPDSPYRRTRMTVPDDAPSIQAAIDAADTRATIRVKPGRYQGPLDFGDKDVAVVSTDGPAKTHLLMSGTSYAAIFEHGASTGTRMEGFTIHAAGGILCRTSSPTIKNNILLGRTGSRCGIKSAGGGSPSIIENRILNFDSAGIACEGGACHIRSNTITSNRGGGIRLEGGTSLLIGNRISRNRAESGGGVHLAGGSTVMDSNILSRNESTEGGGLFAASARVRLAGNTFTKNRAARGGGISLKQSNATMENTIVWMNGAGSPEEILCTQSTFTATHSIIHGGWPGRGNLDADPRFIDPSTDDFHLQWESPCREHGVSTVLPEEGDSPAGMQDFEGDARTSSGRPDIGADEFHPRLYEVRHPSGPPGLRIIGPPGTFVYLGVSRRITRHLGRPVSGGDLLLLGEPILKIRLPCIPETGFFELPLAHPPGFSEGETLYFQALLGHRVTNLFILTATAGSSGKERRTR